MSTHLYCQLRGCERAEPKTGAVVRSRIHVTEICDVRGDTRRYVVTEAHPYTGHVYRSQTFTSPGYYGTPDNLCGRLEDAAARDLARGWSRGD